MTCVSEILSAALNCQVRIFTDFSESNYKKRVTDHLLYIGSG